MQAERCNVELGIFALSQSSKTMWELYRSPGKRAKPLRLINLTSQKEMITFWNYYFLISASGAHTCLHFKGRRIYIGYSWSCFFFILMPFVEDLSCPGEVSDERKADLFLFMLLCRLLGSWHWLWCNFNACFFSDHLIISGPSLGTTAWELIAKYLSCRVSFSFLWMTAEDLAFILEQN